MSSERSSAQLSSIHFAHDTEIVSLQFDSPFFSAIVLFKNKPPWWFCRKERMRKLPLQCHISDTFPCPCSFEAHEAHATFFGAQAQVSEIAGLRKLSVWALATSASAVVMRPTRGKASWLDRKHSLVMTNGNDPVHALP